MMKFKVGDDTITIREGSTKSEIRQQIKEQSPDTYRAMFLGDTPETRESALETGFRQAAEDVGPFEAGLLSAGRTGQQFSQGVRKLFGADTSGVMEDERSIFSALEGERPVSTFLGGAAPYAAIPVGAVAGGIGRGAAALGARGLGQRIAGSRLFDAAAAGAVAGGIEHDTQGLGGAAMGAAGGAIGDALGRGLFARAPSAVNEAAQAAQQRGLRPSPADLYPESKTVRAFQQALESPWFHSARGLAQREKNKKILNKKLRTALGQPENKPLTKATFHEIIEQTDRAFSFPLAATNRLENKLAAIASRRTSTTGAQMHRDSLTRVANMLKRDRGLSPKELAQAVKELDRKASRRHSDATASAFADARDAILDEIELQRGASIGDEVRAAVMKRNLAEAALGSMDAKGVNYQQLLDNMYSYGREVKFDDELLGTMRAGQSIAGGLGPSSREAKTNLFGDWLQHSKLAPAAFGATVGGAIGGPALGAALGAAPGLTSAALYHGGLAPMLDRGVAGALVGRGMTKALTDPAARATRAGGLFLAEDDRGY